MHGKLHRGSDDLLARPILSSGILDYHYSITVDCGPDFDSIFVRDGYSDRQNVAGSAVRMGQHSQKWLRRGGPPKSSRFKRTPIQIGVFLFLISKRNIPTPSVGIFLKQKYNT